MLKRKKYMIGLLIMALSVSILNFDMVLAASTSASEGSYVEANIKTGTDKNGIRWNYKLLEDGTISIWPMSYTKMTKRVLEDGTVRNWSERCNDLSGEIEIPSNIDGLVVSGLSGCNSEEITGVKIPSTIKSIGDSAFYGCKSLRNIEIPSSVTHIGRIAFETTPWIENQRKLNKFVVVNNILVDGVNATGDIIIPSNVITIGEGVFEIEGPESNHWHGNTPKITSIIIPEGVKKIEAGAFSGCSKISYIKFPSTITEIGDWAFTSSRYVKSVEIPNKTVKICRGAFSINTQINIGTSNKGWHKEGESWYWLWSDGTKRYGWYGEDGKWYYFYGNGQMATGFIDLGGGYSYYFEPNATDGKAVMVTGWKYINGKWFYFYPNSDNFKGFMERAGWKNIDGYCYYFYYDGSMAQDTWIDGYYVNHNGVRS